MEKIQTVRFADILDGIDEKWSIKEKARYCYVEICKRARYDERFTFGEDKEQLKQIYYGDVDVNAQVDVRKVCNTVNTAYEELLNKLGIKCKKIYKKSKVERNIEVEDVALIFFDEENRQYFTNLPGDFANCKYGLQTQYFGIVNSAYEETANSTLIPASELMEMDQKLGLVKEDNYSNIVFALIAEEVKNTNNFKKFLASEGFDVKNMTREQILENKLQYLTRLIKFRDKTCGPIERKELYKKLFCSSALDKFESKKFETFEFFKEENSEVDTISCIEVNLSQGPIYYYYSEADETYVTISQEELEEKIKGYKEKKGKLFMNQKKEQEEGIPR